MTYSVSVGTPEGPFHPEGAEHELRFTQTSPHGKWTKSDVFHLTSLELLELERVVHARIEEALGGAAPTIIRLSEDELEALKERFRVAQRNGEVVILSDDGT